MTHDAAPLRLRLVATRPDGDAADLELEARSDTPLEDAVEALAGALGESAAGLRVFSARTGRALDASQTLARAGLRHGDELVLSRNGVRPAHRRSSDERFELAVVGGPAAGRSVPLPATGLTVG